jgi:hypothetical protein
MYLCNIRWTQLQLRCGHTKSPVREYRLPFTNTRISLIFRSDHHQKRAHFIIGPSGRQHPSTWTAEGGTRAPVIGIRLDRLADKLKARAKGLTGACARSVRGVEEIPPHIDLDTACRQRQD